MNAITTNENHALTNAPAVQAGPLAAAMQALQAGMTIEQMQGLMGLQKDWESNEARKAYVADMASFKLNPPEIYKTKMVAFSGTEYMHATLGDVTRAVLDSLARHGFSHNWETAQQNGFIKVTCKITHRLGHSESTSMEAAPDQSGKKNAIQAVASSINYMQRYTLLAACGLATMDIPDDDGRGGSQAPIDYNPTTALAVWISRVDAAVNMDALRKTRGMAGEEFAAAKDVASWNALKAHAANKKATLEPTEGASA
jgi:hypothetical protein